MGIGLNKRQTADVMNAMRVMRPRTDDAATQTAAVHVTRSRNALLGGAIKRLTFANATAGKRDVEVPIIRLPELLTWLFDHDAEFRECFVKAASRSQDRTLKWNLMVGFDEFTPGSKVRPQNWRKMMVVSFAFSEMLDFTCDAAWFTPTLMSTNTIRDIRGGFSCIAKQMFLDTLPTLFDTGVQLNGKLIKLAAVSRIFF